MQHVQQIGAVQITLQGFALADLEQAFEFFAVGQLRQFAQRRFAELAQLPAAQRVGGLRPAEPVSQPGQ